MFQSLFARLLAVFLAVVICVISVGAVFSMMTIRSNSVNAAVESLLSEAREIAFLAGRAKDLTTNHPDMDAAMEYLQWKAEKVYQAYGAYILMVDRGGNVVDNMMTALKTNPNTVETFSAMDIAEILREVLQGKEVQTGTFRNLHGAIFTVAVPWTEDGKIAGAVFIHTSAQRMEAEYRGILPQLILGFSLAFILALMIVVFYTGAVIKPLSDITKAAESMSRGHFNSRAEVTGVDEVRQLAGAFNVMADKLGQVEENRREFVANVSHELRSPVTNILGFAEGMLDDTIAKQDREKYLGIIKDEAMRLKDLIADLLQLSRMDQDAEPLTLTDFDINESIRRVLIGRLTDIERKNLEVQLDFEKESSMVHADSDRITQVIYNLVDNAVKFAKQDGNLTIRTSLVHDKVSVIVENDGTPIAEVDRPHIFERFYKADKAHTAGKGTGLGLSICKKIMEMHGQVIRLLPRADGAAFEVMLAAGEKTPKTDLAEGT